MVEPDAWCIHSRRCYHRVLAQPRPVVLPLARNNATEVLPHKSTSVFIDDQSAEFSTLNNTNGTNRKGNNVALFVLTTRTRTHPKEQSAV